MSVRNELLKHQSVLIDTKQASFWSNLSNDPILMGTFGGRQAQFGIRRVSRYQKEIFYKISLNQPPELPFWLQDYLPLVFEDGADSRKRDLRIEGKRWLVECLRPEAGQEKYFADATDGSMKERFSDLVKLASRIETETFPIERSIEIFKQRNVVGIFWALAAVIGALLIIIFLIGVDQQYGNWWGKGNPSKRSANEIIWPRIIPADSNILLKVSSDKAVVHLKETVTLTYDLLTRYNTNPIEFRNIGQFDGFRVERKSLADQNVKQEVVQYKGKKYAKGTLKTLTLISVKTGEHILYPGSLYVILLKEKKEKVGMNLIADPLKITVSE